MRSRFIIALLLFCVLDFSFRIGFHADPYELPGHSFAWWVVDNFRKSTTNPDIMIFGSSLVRAVVQGGDATYLNHNIDAVLHHRSLCLEDSFYRKTGLKWSTFSFGIGGEMVSDAYSIYSVLVSPKNIFPRLVIYGIAPRDFLDSLLSDPSDSEISHYLLKISGQAHTVANNNFNRIVQSILERISFIGARRQDILTIIKHTQQKLLSIVRTKEPSLFIKHLPPILAQELSVISDENLTAGDVFIEPTKFKPLVLTDNSTEYKARYKNIRTAFFTEQLNLLREFVTGFTGMGTSVVLVNMPLTKRNMDLLPTKIYNLYLDNVSAISKMNNAYFVDLNQGNTFIDSDFSDTVHLNGQGSIKFIQVLTDRLPSKLAQRPLTISER